MCRDMLKRHCEGVSSYKDETVEVHKERIMKFKKTGDRDFTEEGRVAEITVDLVLRAKARMAKDSGLEDSVFAEMIKELLKRGLTRLRHVSKPAS